MINIYMSGEKIYVWNALDVIALRKEHRIVGALAGIYPSKPFQVQTKWLPLQLMPEEACLLIEKGISNLIRSPEKITDPVLIASFFEQRDRLCKEQAVLLKEHRQKEIIEKADEIYEGKKRKFVENALEQNKQTRLDLEEPNINEQHSECVTSSTVKETVESESLEEVDVGLDSDKETSEQRAAAECQVINICDDSENKEKETESSSGTLVCDVDREFVISSQTCDSDNFRTSESSTEIASKNISSNFLDKHTIIEAELAKVSEVSKELCMVQLFTECPWKNMSDVVKLTYPSTEMEKLRYAVFKDLWEKNYYITSGIKFGGDFLAYEGDPFVYHAVFIVVCILPSTKFQAIDILTYGRLGHQVKKTVALASLNDSRNVEYISVNWDNDVV